MNQLSGKKTFIAAITGIVFAVAGVIVGQLEPESAARWVFDGVLAICLRLGIAKA